MSKSEIRGSKNGSAFTLIELVIVMSIIIVLAGLILATSGYVQEKSKRSRTEAEIAAISAALESYKADNGIYPSNDHTKQADPAASIDPKASQFLYGELTGDTNFDGQPEPNTKTYMTFKPGSLKPDNPAQPIGAGGVVAAIRDPFGDPYGYSTMKANDPAAAGGFNPTFDLWSTAGDENGDQAKWIKNW